jgi:hypothetical protein
LRRKILVGTVIVILMVIGFVVALRDRPAPSPPAIESGATREDPKTPVAPPVAPAASKAPQVDGVWTRPPAKVAARNVRRSFLVVTLRPLGASDKLITRLVDGDILAVVTELKQQAQRGDASASNLLDYMVHFNCPFAESSTEASEYNKAQLLDAGALPAGDAEWLRIAMREKLVYNKQWSAVCHQSLDRAEADKGVEAAAAQGDAASHYLRFIFGQGSADRDAQLIDAVAGGYPWAKYTLAFRTIWAPGASADAPSTPNTGELLRDAAVDLPAAQGQLALSEFNGCPGIDPDIPSAVTHAREAAQRGSFDAIREIGPQLQASQIGPDEVAAWNLVYAALEQQGCADQAINVELMKSVSRTLNPLTISTNAKALAEQYWQHYGTQMMSNLGCTS